MKKFRRIAILAFCLAVLLAAGGCAAIDNLKKSRIGREVTVGGVDVSRMRVEEARALLADAFSDKRNAIRYTLQFTDCERVILPGDIGLAADIEGALSQAAALPRRAENRSIRVEWRADPDKVQSVVRRVADAHSSAPADALVAVDFTRSVPFIYTEERTGVSIDRDALAEALTEAAEAGASARILVPESPVHPAVTLSDIQSERQCIAAFATSFQKAAYSKAPRVFNIQKAAAAIHGTVLEPGETFDCNAALGDRNKENGWRMAAGIRNGAYVNEYGGGVCQVSSTLFNAVMMADLLITERHPHSWPMGYVGIGRDATISTGGKNFRFVNSSDAPVYICASTDPDAMTLTVTLYGAPLPDGEHITIRSEDTGALAPAADEVLLDESLPYNTRVITREARTGRTARTYKEYRDAEGNLLRSEVVYEDVYRSIPAEVYVSPDLYPAADG